MKQLGGFCFTLGHEALDTAKQANYAKLQDRLPVDGIAGGSEPAELEPLLGTWKNTNKATGGITTAVLTRNDGHITLRVFGAGDPEPHDWGETKVNAFFADGIDSRRAISFTADYDFEFLQTELQTNLSKGLLIITSLNKFKDGGARSSYFSREYFYQEPESD